jgi:dihydroorotate dehydrogenase (fumarate)
MIGYDFDQFENVLKAITALPDFGKIPLGLKLPPYFDFPHFEKAAQLIVSYPIRFITTTNNIGNVLIIDWENECEALVAKSGFGGLGGGFIKHTALANVRLFHRLLHEKHDRPDISIIGVGGVSSGRDAFEMILCGANAVQVGSCHWIEGSTCFERISNELEEIMKSKGFRTIEDFRGKLKPYQKNTRKEANESSEPQKEKGSQLLSQFNIILLVVIAILIGKSYMS